MSSGVLVFRSMCSEVGRQPWASTNRSCCSVDRCQLLMLALLPLLLLLLMLLLLLLLFPSQVTFPATLDMYEFCAPSLQAILKVKWNRGDLYMFTIVLTHQTSGTPPHHCRIQSMRVGHVG